MISEPETREEPPNRDLATIREAQRVVGELVWVATRTRPDLAFTITKLKRSSTSFGPHQTCLVLFGRDCRPWTSVL